MPAGHSASARIPKFSWKGGEIFSCDLYILNDLYENIPSGVVHVKLKGSRTRSKAAELGVQQST